MKLPESVYGLAFVCGIVFLLFVALVCALIILIS